MPLSSYYAMALCPYQSIYYSITGFFLCHLYHIAENGKLEFVPAISDHVQRLAHSLFHPGTLMGMGSKYFYGRGQEAIGLAKYG